MVRKRAGHWAGLALAAAILAPGAALADAIDGDWCSPGGARHLHIQGAKIKTPGGVNMEGVYTRHSFDYVAPAGEREAGKRVAMRLVNEQTVLFRPDGEPREEVWNRCNRPNV